MKCFAHLQQWLTRLKITPYFVKKVQTVSLKGLAALLEMSTNTDEELRDLALFLYICFTAMRLEVLKNSKN